jgi:hypothetical protein
VKQSSEILALTVLAKEPATALNYEEASETGFVDAVII